MLVAAWLILMHLWSREDHRGTHDVNDVDLGAAVLCALMLPLVMAVFMPYLVWVAVRDAGQDRRAAAWWVSLAVAGSVLVAVLAGSWWWLPVAAFVVADLAILHIGIRVYRDKKAEEKALLNHDEWFTNRR